MSTNLNDKHPLTIAFGRGNLTLSLPPEAAPTVVRKRSLPKLKDAAGTIAQAFSAPIGSAPLGELARGKKSACILICDITRPVPNRLFLRPMIEILAEAGIPLDRITVLVATGLHRPNLGEELAELVGAKSKIRFGPLLSDDPRQRQPDIFKAKTVLGRQPKTQLRERLAKTIAYFDSILSEGARPFLALRQVR